MSSGEVAEFPVEEEYKKNPDISREDISKLRQWLHTQPHLPSEHISDLDLIVTYHCSHNSIQVAKQVFDLHFTLRTLFTAFFKGRRFNKSIQSCLDTVLIVPLPTPTVHGYRAVYVRLIDCDPRGFRFAETVKAFTMMFDLWQREEGTWPGVVIVIDMQGAVVGHLLKVDVMSVRQVLYFLQEAMLMKLKEVHFVNVPYFIDKVLMLIKPFVKKELLDLLQVHEVGSEEFYKYVTKESLPKESGGQYKSIYDIKDELADRFRSNEAFFQEESKRRVKESLRPGGKATTVESIFGIEGSFKKLDID